jgi:UDP-3-O-[3-hydroxymyristoyl] glucosamine N-acyltransferase
MQTPTKSISVSDVLSLSGSRPGLQLELASGSQDLVFSKICPPDKAEPGCAVFVSQPKFLDIALTSPAGLVVAKRPDEATTGLSFASRSVVWCSRPDLAMALALRLLGQSTPDIGSEFLAGSANPDSEVRATQFIHSSASVHPTAEIGPHVVIGSRSQIGARVRIGANTVIERDVEIGDDTAVQPLVYIGPRTVIGQRCEIGPGTVIGKEGFGYAHDAKGEQVRIPHQGRVVLENDVHIGANCAIDRGTFGETRIGHGTKIDNLAHLAHNFRVGSHSMLTAGFMTAGSSELGSFVVTGGRVSVGGHIKIADGVQLAALSGVVKSIDKPGQYGGYPLLPLNEFLRLKVALTKLPSLLKSLKNGSQKDSSPSD